MRTLVRFVSALFVVAAVAYPSAAWYLGTRVEAAVSEPYAQLAGLPYLKVIKREYKRGVFSSDETATFELFGPVPSFINHAEKQKVASSPDEPNKPFLLTVRSHIRHGPLPDGKVFAAAMVDSELDVDERLRPDLAQVLGAQKLLTAHTLCRFAGDGESVITSPAFAMALPGAGADAGGRLSWEGVRVTIRFTRDLGSYTTEAEAPKLDIAGKGAHIVIAGMRFDTESKRIFDDEPMLYSGKQKISIVQAAIDGRDISADPILLRELSYDVNIPVNGEFIDIVAKIGIRDVIVGETNFGPAHYDISLKRLHARSVAQLQRAMVKLYSDPAAMAGTKNPVEGFEPLAAPTMKLLEFNPEVSLDRISFNSPKGEVLIAARAKFDAIRPEDFGKPTVFMAKLRASADIALPEALLVMPWGMNAETTEAAQAQMSLRQKQFAALAEQGYIRYDGAMARSKLEFSNGQLTVNGKEFDPGAMQNQAPAQARPPMRPNSGSTKQPRPR